MVFRSFRINCVLRIAALSMTAILLAWLLINTNLYATSIAITVALLLQIWLLIRFVDRSHRDWARFLTTIRDSDFSINFGVDDQNGTYAELRQAFQMVLDEFKKTRIEKEEHLRFVQGVMMHINIGLIAFDTTGKVDFSNVALRRMLDLPEINTLADIRSASNELFDSLRSIQPGAKDQVRIERDGRQYQVAVLATEFKMGTRSLKLVSLQDIANELAAQEMEAWQQLVRVLTHEIINSVTPIASMAGSVGKLLNSYKKGKGDRLSKVDMNDLDTAAITIERRSLGLIKFVRSYRQLTKVPKPKFELVPVTDLFERMLKLISSHSDADNIEIKTTIDPPSLEIVADPDLMEQVLINLLTNAVQAVSQSIGGEIDLMARLNKNGRVSIRVVDNGPGIDSESLESVFVPFYTTKVDGTGIGLSLARQIVRMHGGELTVISRLGSGATFSVNL